MMVGRRVLLVGKVDWLGLPPCPALRRGRLLVRVVELVVARVVGGNVERLRVH